MTSKAGTSLDYGTTSPKHAVKSHGTTTYTYDANGSLTAKGTQTIKYDPEQRPILVQDGSNYSRAAYDGDGVRRKRQDSNGTVHYLGGYERKLAGGSNSSDMVTKYYSASLGAMSRPVAFRRGGTLHWVGSDHLGGTVRIMDSSFTALDGMRYKPYGEDRDTGSSLNTDRKFTGQTEDETAGLYWYASRAYDPAIGRFVSPDSIVPAPGNPQSLNRYSYVYNNPLKYVDPTGHYNVENDTQWRREFFEQYSDYPTASDNAYRQASMEAALRGQDFSVEYWAGLLERAASNVADSVGHTIEQAKTSIHNTVEQTKTSIENAAKPLVEKATNIGETIVDTYESLSTPESYYIVQDPDGYEFIVRENVASLKLAAPFGGPRAVVFSPDEIWSSGPIEYGSKGFWHERGHVEQMSDMGQVEYLATFWHQKNEALRITRGNDLEAQKIHPMEVDANRKAGLPDDWIQSREIDWRAR